MLVVMWIIARHNAARFPRLSESPSETPREPLLPFVSVMVPARNEATNIARVVTQILAQDYPAFELLVIDDHSCDDTTSLAHQAIAGDARALVITGTPLPPTWLGKHWACHQLAQHAKADYLLFTDADVRWQENALRAIMAHQQETDAALLTVWPHQQNITLAERIIVPLMPFILLAFLPVDWAHDSKKAAATAANGQCMLFKREAYEEVGGHYAVRDNVLDDVTLAYNIKQRRLPLRMADGGSLLSCRMYDGWRAATEGFSKNILAAHGNSTLLLMLSVAMLMIVFGFPLAWLIGTGIAANWTAAAWACVLLVMGIGVRMATGDIAGLRRIDALWMPVSVLLMAYISANALWQHWRHGGPEWKGRRIRLPRRGIHADK